ncbi:MAG: hypothetical protein ACRDZM_18995 [Acidimicrobiia bacterium]
MHSRRATVVVAALGLLIVACGGPTGEPEVTTTETESTTTALETTTSAPAVTSTSVAAGTTTTIVEITTTSSANEDGSDGSGCTPGTANSLPEGHWFGFVVSTAVDSIEFDLACWFSGQAAIDAAAEDGAESPPPNDYYVRNQDDQTRQIVVWSDADVVYYPTGDPTSETEGTFEEWTVAASSRGYYFGVWLDMIDGEATSIMEQWVP